MSDREGPDRIWLTLNRILASAPAAIPVAGQIYSTFRSSADSDEVKALLMELLALNSEAKSDLSALMRTTITELESLIQQLKLFAVRPASAKLIAVVPVGGKGGSMFPITSVMPKCLVYVGERTMLQHILNSFVPYPNVFKKVVVVSRSFSSAIRENIRQGGYGEFVECRECDKTVPGALLDLQDDLRGTSFLLHYSDILLPSIDWAHVKERYDSATSRNQVSAMLLCSSYYPVGIGVITEKEPEMLGTFDEKPEQMHSSGLASTGVAVFGPELLQCLRGSDSGVFEDSFRRLLEVNQRVALYRVGKWHHIHELRDLHEIQRLRGESA